MSVRMLADETGTVTDSYDYDAFGDLYAQTGITPNHYLYTGQQYDAETGLYSLRARYYAPGVGRFLSRDKFPYNYLNPTELNRYAYVTNNPINNYDPSGFSEAALSYMPSRDSISPLAALGAAVKWLYAQAIAWVYLSPLIPAVLLLANNPAVYDLVGAAANYTYDTGQYADFYDWASTTLRDAADDAANWRDKAKAGIQDLADDVADAANQATVLQNTTAFVDALTDAAADTWDKGKKDDEGNVIRVRHYSFGIQRIRASMSIGIAGAFSIFAEYPITTPRTEAMMKEKYAILRPGRELTGVVEFNVDTDKWKVIPDIFLRGINSVEILLVLKSGDHSYLKTGFRLSESGVNPAFFDAKGNPIL